VPVSKRPGFEKPAGPTEGLAGDFPEFARAWGTALPPEPLLVSDLPNHLEAKDDGGFELREGFEFLPVESAPTSAVPLCHWNSSGIGHGFIRPLRLAVFFAGKHAFTFAYNGK